MSRRTLSALAVVGALALAPPGAASYAVGGSDPYFGSNLDCAPVLTDRQALDLTKTTRNVVESVKTGPGPADYLCSWSVAGKGRGLTVVVGVNDLKPRSARKAMWEGMCAPDNPLPRDLRRRLCAAAEDLLLVATPTQALESYTTLMQAVSGHSGKTKLLLADGTRGYWVGGISGGAVTLIRTLRWSRELGRAVPGWTLIHAACLNLAVKAVERDCSVELLETVLRNFRVRAEEFCEPFEGKCSAPVVTPVPRSPKQRR